MRFSEALKHSIPIRVHLQSSAVFQNTHMSAQSIILTAVACGLTFVSLAAEPEDKSARRIRLLAVGDNPPFRQEIRNGVRFELNAPLDSIPPREVDVRCGKESAAPVALHLGRISMPVAVPAGLGILDLKRGGETPDASPWLRIQRPESGDFLVLIWRDPTKKNWRDAVSLSVPDGPAGSPAGTVRIVNIFPHSVRIMWGDETLVLAPGKTIARPVRPGAEMPFQILVADKAGGMQRYYSGNVTQNQGERSLVTIYQADGVAPRRPLKVAVLREPVIAEKSQGTRPR